MNSVLFVCSGNTCRSPMAIAAWQALEREKPLPDWIAQSAGTIAACGVSASQYAQNIADSWQIDLSTHASQPLTGELVAQAQRIVTMTHTQAEIVQAQFPEAAGKLEVLGRYAAPHSCRAGVETTSAAKLQQLLEGLVSEESTDIRDPFGGSMNEYSECGEQIWNAVKSLREDLRNTAP